MSAASELYEKLSVFYLGKEYDLDQKRRTDDLLLYDSKDLVTHAVIVGMTGSGKTGLGICLLEEAAIDGIPALIIDPKGDLSNLLLQFPELRGADFEPWLHADDAARRGMSVADYAAQVATQWKQGLADWGQDAARIAKLSESAEFTIYTPGSDAGRPVSILASFAAPPPAIREDGDWLRDRVSTTATSLLALLGITADPLRSREHILLTNLFHQAWSQGQDLDLGSIIQSVQNPPFTRVGVMEMESFFPAADRFQLAMALNNLLAAPGFATWLSGEPLDIDRLLYTDQGKPRHAIFSIAHLSESERMFFVSLLLNQTLGWMRSRPGTTSLRALLYIDEIFGYLPPVKEPPSKRPLLTLLKQARAFGLGVIVATQNPVDLDYKGLSNTGTWFLGRLQTERDKQRVLEGLEGASAEAGGPLDRAALADLLSQLGQRVFLMHNVHEDRPAIFESRWVLSYLAGPMTRHQIRQLTQRGQPSDPPTPETAPADRPTHSAPRDAASTRPLLPPDVPEVFLPPDRPVGKAELTYEAAVLAAATVHFVDSRRGLAADESLLLLADIEDGTGQVDWSRARALTLTLDDLGQEPLEPCRFAALPPSAGQASQLRSWQRRLSEHLYRSRRYELFQSKVLGEYSQPGESERDFRIRLTERAREQRDRELEQLRRRYATKLQALEDRIRRAEHTVEKEIQEAESAKMQTAISFGATILGAVLGRKAVSSTSLGRATTTARGYGRLTKQSDDVRRAQEKLMAYREQIVEMEANIQAEADQIRAQFDPLTASLETIALKPRKTDVDLRLVAIAWVPGLTTESGQILPLVQTSPGSEPSAA